jgi:hypothetical protein
MAQVVYRGNLSAKVFPFIYEYFGQTVIIPGPDQNFQRQIVSAEDMDKDRGVPQILYCHNVMPSAEGFQSVGYTNRLTDTKSGFTDIFTLRDTAGNEVYFAHTTNGNNYILPFGSTVWVAIAAPGLAGVLDAAISSATMNGQSYLYFANIGCFMYDATSSSLIQVTLTGLEATKVIGITSSAGYMVAWTDNSIAWSSTVEHTVPTDPIDFAPSLTTGAGGGNVEAAKGKITLCVPHYLGFIIYTTENAVAAAYSGNARFPFNLREIVNSGGLNDKSLVAFDSSSGNHYAYTTSGLQLVSISQTQTVFSEVTDFISGNYFEDFDEDALEFTNQTLTAPMVKSINVVGDRYLVISYGVSSLTHALVYDITMKRFGKLRLSHITCFEWKQLGGVIENPRQSVGFLQSNGSILTVDFSYSTTAGNGVMLLGKYQLMRTRMLTLEEVTLDVIKSTNNFKLYNMVSYDGKTLQPAVEGYLAGDYGNSKRYTFHATGLNHVLLAKGNFYCTSIVLKFHINGRR